MAKTTSNPPVRPSLSRAQTTLVAVLEANPPAPKPQPRGFIFAVWHQNPLIFDQNEKAFWGFVMVPPKKAGEAKLPRWFRLRAETCGALEEEEKAAKELAGDLSAARPVIPVDQPVMDEMYGPLDAGTAKCFIKIAQVDEDLYELVVGKIRSTLTPTKENRFNWAKLVIETL